MATPAGSQRLAREDWKKQKELEEARKAGTVAPEKDEEGNDINPHIPQYIAQAPWYLNNTTPSLKHQRAFNAKNDYTSDWYVRGARKGPAATQYRKGACTNCGAMTHKAKECCERPRKVGARWTGVDIQPDEVIKELNLDFDGKRDRWNGYDPSEHTKLLEQYEKLEDERRRLKKEEEIKKLMEQGDKEKNASTKKGDESDSDSDVDENDDKADFLDTDEKLVGVKKDSRTRTTIRNLRIREDTAKYLRNLDINSAYYDPKSRSMRENPNPNAKPEEQLYAGDNFVRQSGDSQKFNNVQLYAFQAYERGQEIHLEGAPSQAELLYKEFNKKKEALLEKQKKTILEKYGGEEHLEAPPKTLLLAQTEEYVEYTPDGNIAKGRTATVPTSKYEENVLVGNHTAIWGSYWENGQWGFACCKQLVKGSYCTGKAGIQARKEIAQDMVQRQRIQEQRAIEESKKQEEEESKKQKEKEEKFKKALKEEEALAKGVERDERKRAYNSLKADSVDVTEEEMEAYHLKRKRFDDPMAQFV